jgi:hypothetical protein
MATTEKKQDEKTINQNEKKETGKTNKLIKNFKKHEEEEEEEEEKAGRMTATELAATIKVSLLNLTQKKNPFQSFVKQMGGQDFTDFFRYCLKYGNLEKEFIEEMTRDFDEIKVEWKQRRKEELQKERERIENELKELD